MFAPGAIGQIPLHGFAQPAGKSLLRHPAEFALDLARINGVAQIVTGAILHKDDEIAVVADAGRLVRCQLFEQ